MSRKAKPRRPARPKPKPRHVMDRVSIRRGPGGWIEVSMWVLPEGGDLKAALHAFADDLQLRKPENE